jgi:hypothetical protein
LGEKAKRFTNVFIKNFSEDLSLDELTKCQCLETFSSVTDAAIWAREFVPYLLA